MHSSLSRWSRGLYLAGMVLALILAVPAAWFPFALGKVAVFAVLLILSALCFLLGGGGREFVRAHGAGLSWLVVLLPLSYLLSAGLSTDRAMAWMGFALEPDTVVFVCLLFAAFMMSFLLFRTLRTVRLLLMVLAGALVVAALFQWANILWGGVPPLSSLADRSANLIGKWNDLGLLVGLLLSLILVSLEFAHHRTWRYAALCAAAVALVVLLGFINFSLIWGLLLAMALFVGGAAFMMGRSEEGTTRMPWASLALAAVAALLLFFGGAVNTSLTAVFPVSSLEVRPSFSSSMELASQAHQGSLERTLVGTGPGTFGQAWLAHKPSAVNQSNFWSLDFNTGYSVLTTAFLTTGALGALMWLVPMLLVLVAVLRVVRLRALTREDRTEALMLAGAALFMLASLIFYVPSQNLMLLAFMLGGAAWGFFWRQERAAISGEHRPLMQWAGLLGALAILLVAAGAGFMSARRAVAEGLVGQGQAALSGGNYMGALAAARQSLKVDKTADGYLLSINANTGKLQAIVASTSPAADIQQQFTNTLQAAIAAGQAEEALYPHDYRAYSLLGDLYAALLPLKINGAYQSALASYQKASALNPSGPQLALAMARLEAAEGNGTAVQADLKQALTLKPNYTDAMLFLVQLAVDNRDLNTAVQAAQAAVQSAPGVPSIWFELGLLYYTGNDMKDAITALQQALALEGDYANAKYYLGLAQYAQGDSQDAIKQFEDLAKTNPGNQDVASILANMQAGKAAFGTSTPAQRTTAPVAQ